MKSDAEKEAGAVILREYGNFFKKQYLDVTALTDSDYKDENKTFVPIQVRINPEENLLLVDLLASDNTLMTKVLSVLTSLCVEICKLKEEAFQMHFPFLSVYDEFTTSDVSSQMNAICKLNSFVARCDSVMRNLCSQVFAIYTEAVVNLNGVQLHYIINHMGELFTLIVLTEVLINNNSLTRKWQKYCKDLKTFVDNPEKLNFSADRFNSMMGAIENINTKLMSDNIVQNCLSNLSNLRQKLVDKNCTFLINEMTQYIKQAIANLDRLVLDSPSYLYKCIKINTLFVLCSNLFGVGDKKVFKSLMDLNAKAHSVPIVGTTTWYPEQFLQRYIPSLFSSQTKLSQAMVKARQTFVLNKKTTLVKEVSSLQQIGVQWVLSVEECFTSRTSQMNASQMNNCSKVMLKGLEIASQIQHTVLNVINLHLSLGIPLSKSLLMAIFETVDVLKSMKDAVNRNSFNISSSINMVVQHLLFQATAAILGVKKTLMADKNYANQRLDELTCIVIAEKSLKGAATKERLIAANMALSFLPEASYTEDVYTRLGLLLEKIQALSTFTSTMDSYCNCSWLLWHQNVIPIYLEQNFPCQSNANKLKHFLSVLQDCAVLLNDTEKQFDAEKQKEFVSNIQKLIEEKIVLNASQQIETNLRLHIHSHLQLDVPNPFTTDLMKTILLTVDNFRLMQVYMSTIPSVEHYLSTMYYNLTTVVLSDWKTYGEMRQMAKFKFHLTTVNDHLPTQTLEQGLDVLEIMRNIHIFVSKYLYNLNNQIFVEKSSNNKHLNSINIKHVANSIRTHGTGIMNTTVNFTYQFLKKKFFTFSQFLYDEQIKSKLVKDIRNFKENSVAYGNSYPYKNADKFNKGIKNLGLANDGQSYLDLFRDLISQIGNAMGYVRMVRSGGRHCCADATVFLPSLEKLKSFKELAEESSVDPTTAAAAETLDNNIDNLVDNFMQGTEYFKLLVDVFAHIFRNPKNVHLSNFYVIVPPLTVNFVEHMTLAKDKMTKKNKVGAAFTDDGFAMGVAYILKLLDQDASFECLHWFESVWKHIRDERKSLDEQKTRGSAQLQLALALTEKKLAILEQEFQLLYFSLTSARIFFR